MSGVRAGVVVFVGVGFANLCNYGFHLVSARSLGPASYSDVATLAAVVGVISLPLGGVQVFVARHVATGAAAGRPTNDGGYVSGFGGMMLLLGVVLTVVLAATGPLIRSALSIASVSAVVLAMLVTAPSFLAPAMVGAAQGCRRFVLVAASLAVAPAVRVVLAAAALGAGLGVAGTMAATLVAAVVAAAVPLAVLWHELGPVRAWRPRLSRADALALLPVLVGMLAITCLTTDDLVAAKVSFSSHEAGLYGSASLIGRVILYLPVAIVTVLLPYVAARASAGHETGGLFRRSFVATGACSLLFTAVYAAAPHLIVRVAFGARYQGSASLLWWFGVAMTLYSLLNVVLVYRLGRGATGIAWLLLGGVAVQAALFVAFHASPRQLLASSIGTAALLLAASAVLGRGPETADDAALAEYATPPR